MVAVSWGVFWIPADDLNSQLLISVTTVLTLVAFSVALSNILPPVPYLTFYDAFFLICFLFILLTIVEVLIAHTVHRRVGPHRRAQNSPPHAPVPARSRFSPSPFWSLSSFSPNDYSPGSFGVSCHARRERIASR